MSHLASWDRYRWRVLPRTLLCEMLMKRREKNELKLAENVDLFYKKANKR